MNEQQITLEFEALAGEYEQIMPEDEITAYEEIIEKMYDILTNGLSRIKFRYRTMQNEIQPVDYVPIVEPRSREGSASSDEGSVSSADSTSTQTYKTQWFPGDLGIAVEIFNTTRYNLNQLVQIRNELAQLYNMHTNLSDRSMTKQVHLYNQLGSPLWSALMQSGALRSFISVEAKKNDRLLRAKYLIQYADKIALEISRELVSMRASLLENINKIPVPMSDLDETMQDEINQLRFTPIPLDVSGRKQMPSWIELIGQEMRGVFG